MANRLVIRYYPVDGEWSPARYQHGKFGLALHLSPVIGPYDDFDPTMGVTPGNFTDRSLVTNESEDYWSGRWATVTDFVDFSEGGIQPGEYIEKEIYLLAADGVTVVPVDETTLPLQATVAGLGAHVTSWWEDPDVVDIEERAQSYAGGALEFGIYTGDTYVPCASIWVKGTFFQPKYDGTSWSSANIPAPTPDALELVPYQTPWDQANTLSVRLALGPPTGFWTQLVRATQTGTGAAAPSVPDPEEPVDPEEPGEPGEPGEPSGTHRLVAGKHPWGSEVGFQFPQYGEFGTLTPGTLDVDGEPVEIALFYGRNVMVGAEITLEFTQTVSGIVRAVLPGLMPPGHDYVDFLLNGSEYFTLYMDSMQAFEEGETYDITLTWIG